MDIPAMTFSTAYSKLKVSTDFSPSLAACNAASLQMLAMSAPTIKSEKYTIKPRLKCNNYCVAHF